MYGQNMYNNPTYFNNLQDLRARIDEQLRQAQIQQPLQQTPSINQTFQLAPQSNLSDLDGKYAKDIDEVKNTLALKTTLFTDKDFKTLWIKNADGSIKTYELNEIIEIDAKDKQILELQEEIEKMKEMMINAKSDNAIINEQTTNSKSTRISTSKPNDDKWSKSTTDIKTTNI